MLTLRVGVLALCLMASLPFLVPVHTAPIPSFHAEWLAAALGLAAAVALLGARRLPLPGAALLALALAAIAALQALLGRAPVPQLTEMFGLYLLWAALLASAASHIAATLGRKRLAKALAAAILLGAILAALTALFQPLLKQAFGWVGFGPAMGGALGQRNHFSDYLWLGLACALYLRVEDALPRGLFWPAAVLLTLTAALGGQRSSLLYAATLVAVALWHARSSGSSAARLSRRLAIDIAALFLLMQPVAMLLPALIEYEGTPPPALRAVSELRGPSMRVDLARLGLHGVAQAPLLGNGIGSFPSLALAFADDIPPADNPGPTEHGHNLLLDLGVEAGIPAALLLFAAALLWLRSLLKRCDDAEIAWAVTLFAILGLHSMIEYPLWHTYFLGLLAIVAGAYGKPRAVGQRLAPVALALGLMAWGGVILAASARDYALLEAALRLGRKPETITAAREALIKVPADSLLVPWVNTTACVSLDPLRAPVADGLAVCKATAAFAPTIESSVNHAVLVWRSGSREQAADMLHRLSRASRYDPRGIMRRLVPLEARDADLKAIEPN